MLLVLAVILRGVIVAAVVGGLMAPDETPVFDEGAEAGRSVGVVGDLGPGVRSALYFDCDSCYRLVAG